MMVFSLRCLVYFYWINISPWLIQYYDPVYWKYVLSFSFAWWKQEDINASKMTMMVFPATFCQYRIIIIIIYEAIHLHEQLHPNDDVGKNRQFS
jgi:hypothetical protein